MKVCKRCGREFEQVQANQCFCSKACRDAHNYDIKVERARQKRLVTRKAPLSDIPPVEGMIKTSIKLCRKCRYFGGMCSGYKTCHYLLITLQRRDCPVGWCNKFEPKKEGRL